MTPAPAPVPALKAARRPDHSDAARFAMSSAAVTLAVTDVSKWTTERCVRFLATARWSDASSFSCPHCGSIAAHYWRRKELRWKCRACDKTFSVTSGTVFANRRAPIQKLLAGLLLFVNCPSGQPALELRRHLKVSYSTAFTWQHKLREALIRGFNVGLLSGDLEMDGSHRSGWRAAAKRGRPQGAGARDEREEQEKLDQARAEAIAKIEAANEGRGHRGRPPRTGAFNPETGQRLDRNRRLLVTVHQRSGARGSGACATRLLIGKAEDATVAGAVARTFIAIPESLLNTDTSPAYTELGRRFRDHRTVEHSKTLVGPNGENDNQAESFSSRMKRAEKGVYLNIEPKYLFDYAVEMAFREDVRRLPNDRQLQVLLHHALNVGRSVFWRGFTHGQHRNYEFLATGEEPAAASGPRKGCYPIAANRGRPPR